MARSRSHTRLQNSGNCWAQYCLGEKHRILSSSPAFCRPGTLSVPERVYDIQMDELVRKFNPSDDVLLSQKKAFTWRKGMA
jgi:hypothetical protein